MSRMLRLFAALGAATVCLAAASPTMASVGFRRIAVPTTSGQPIEVALWYPADAPAQPMSLGLIRQEVAADAPMVGERMPLIVMSHGNGGFWGGHADTAAALADAGFIVVAPTHPGDNFRDHSRATDLPARPRQLRFVLDYVLEQWSERDRIDPERIGAFGFSAGGFTVMSSVGAQADPEAIQEHCRAAPDMFECRVLASTAFEPAAWRGAERDERIKAVVAAAPGFGYAFTDESLSAIRIPIQLWQASNDQVLSAPHHVEPIRDRVSGADYHSVPGAQHFDFLSPCAPQAAVSEPELCGSAPGFDRTAFHVRFNAEVVRFFKKALAR